MQNKKTKTVIKALAVVVAVIIIILLLTRCGKQEPVIESTGMAEGSSELITSTPPVIAETDPLTSAGIIESYPVETSLDATEDPSMSSEDIEASSDATPTETIEAIVSSEEDTTELFGPSSVSGSSEIAYSETPSSTTQVPTVPSSPVIPTSSQIPTTATPTVPPTAPTTRATTPVPTTPTPTTPAPTTQPPTAHSHSFGDWVILRHSTCTTLGLRRKTCSCGAWHEESIPKSNDHEWVTEQVLVRPAWDEQVLVKEAWEEQVLVKEAWDEVVIRERYVYVLICKGCENNGVYFDLAPLSGDEVDEHMNVHFDKGEDVGAYSWYRTEQYEELIHHDAEYTTVYHPPEYTTVHHEAEYANVEKCKNCGRFKY